MTIILFLIDTSSSMCQKAYVNGVQKSYLDIAKGAVETFLKYRQRTQDCLGDRYMLLTFEEPPSNVKAGWKENHATFMNELKNLQSHGLTSMGESLKNAFDLLNLNRMQSGIDTYGQGRCPFYLEPSVIIVITDGGRYSFRNGVHQEIILPLNTQIPGTKFTKEPFRWDQRLFSLVLRMSGNKIDERVEGKVPHDDSPIEKMCEVTGGRSYRIRSHYVLNQCLESLVQKVQTGVVLQFEPMMPRDGGVVNEDIVFQPMKKMIFIQKHLTQKTFPMGSWPLPEPYWPDPKALSLPPRDAHPKIRIVTPGVDEPQMVRSFPVDKYEVEASPLTLQILQKREPNKCWQVIVSNGMHGFELPFGYLKASPNFTQVHLYVLAYNYPALLPLLHDLIHKYNMSPTNDLIHKFSSYVRSIPPYYCPFLRKALLSINVPYPLLQFLLPENVDNYLSPNIASQLKHIKNTAKQDQENLCMKVYKQLKQPKPPYRQVETAKLNPGVPIRRELVRHPLLKDTFSKLHAELEPLENYTIVVPQITRQSSAKSYRNPFDIPRRDLIEEIARMRESFLRPTLTSLIAKDSGYSLPIAEMGNYQEYLKNKDNPLREIEPTNVRQHMFGNPYKKDRHMVMVDEADLSDVAPIKNGNGAPGGGVMNVGNGSKKMDANRSRKRKAGPIRKDFVFRRIITDNMSSKSSSMSSASSVCSSSDYEDSISDTSSISSGRSVDGDPERIGAFDFAEEEQQDADFPLNGHVQNFINGYNDESNCDYDVNLNPALNNNNNNNHNNNMHNNINMNNNNNHNMNSGSQCLNMPMQQHPGASTPNPYITGYGHLQTDAMAQNLYANIPPNGPATPGSYQHFNGNAQYGYLVNPQQAMQMNPPAVLNSPGAAPNMAAMAAAAANTYHQGHNDISDPQEISRILQQCHNGVPIPQVPGVLPDQKTSLEVMAALNQSHQLQQMQQQHQHQHQHQLQQQLHHQPAMPGVMAGTMIKQQPHIPQQMPPPLQHLPMQHQHPHQQHLQQLHPQQQQHPHLQPHLQPQLPPQLPHQHPHPHPHAHPHQAMPMPHPNANPHPNHFDSLKKSANHLPNNLLNSNSNNINNINSNGNNNNNNNNNNNSQNHNRNASSRKQNAAAAAAAAAAAMLPPPLSFEKREEIKKHNLKLRGTVFHDIRRPGRDYTQLLNDLEQIQGDNTIKSTFVKMCVQESLRFRRELMANTIKEWWSKKSKENHPQHQNANS